MTDPVLHTWCISLKLVVMRCRMVCFVSKKMHDCVEKETQIKNFSDDDDVFLKRSVFDGVPEERSGCKAQEKVTTVEQKERENPLHILLTMSQNVKKIM